EARHPHAERNLDVVFLEGERPARHDAAQVLDPQRKRYVVLTVCDRSPGFPERKRAATAGAFDVDRGLPDEPYFLKCSLPDAHALIDMAAEGYLYLSRMNAGVFYGRPRRLTA